MWLGNTFSMLSIVDSKIQPLTIDLAWFFHGLGSWSQLNPQWICVWYPPHNWIAKIVRNNRIGLVVKFQLVIDNDTQIINGDLGSIDVVHAIIMCFNKIQQTTRYFTGHIEIEMKFSGLNFTIHSTMYTYTFWIWFLFHTLYCRSLFHNQIGDHLQLARNPLK